MDINAYLSALGEKLRGLGVGEEDISKQLKITRNYLESLDDDERSETLNDSEQIDVVASNIYIFIQKKKAQLVETNELNKVLADSLPTVNANGGQNVQTIQSAAVQPQITLQPVQTSQQITVQNVQPVQSVQPQPVPSPTPVQLQPSAGTSVQQSAKRPEIRKYNTSELTVDHDPSSHSSSFKAVQSKQNRARRDLTSEGQAVHDRRYDDSRYFTASQNRAKRSEKQYTSESSSVQYSDDDYKVEKAHGSPLFWILFIGTLPFTALVYLILFVLFGILFAAGSVIIVALIAVLIADIAAGTAVSLVGIIYGITQIVNPATRPIGLYELGLGLLIGGAAMFIGIIIYNIAIRLLPFLLKKLTALLRFILGKFKDLYYTLKRRSSSSERSDG